MHHWDDNEKGKVGTDGESTHRETKEDLTREDCGCEENENEKVDWRRTKQDPNMRRDLLRGEIVGSIHSLE